jgi:hypothetical protein
MNCNFLDKRNGQCALWQGHDGDHCFVSLINTPQQSMTWTSDYQAGWSEGYRHGVWEGLCRAENAIYAVKDKMRTAGPDDVTPQ